MAIANDLGISPVGHLVAGEDLSAMQYHLVQLDDAGAVVAPTGQGVRTLGVLLNAPASGEAATVQVHGIARVYGGASVSAAATGVSVTAAGTSGEIGAASSGDYPAGILIGSAADGELAEILLTPATVPLA